MATYDYRVTDAAGRLVTGSMEAKDEDTLVARLRELGYLPIEVGLSRGGFKSSPASWRPNLSPRVKGRDVAAFTHELQSMLSAGMALDRALSILSGVQGAALRPVVDDIARGIQGGRTLAECLEAHPKAFPAVYVNTVRAGETGGSLEGALERLARLIEDSERLKEDLKSALIYPMVLTFASASAIVVMLLFVIPRFEDAFAELGGAMPLPTRMLLLASSILAGYWWAAVLAFAASILAARRYLRSGQGREALDRMVLRLPVAGGVAARSAASRFSRTLGTLLQGGLPVTEALGLAVSTMGNSYMESKAAPIAEGVRKGRGIAAPLRESGVFPEVAAQMLAIGEETGRLDEVLIKLADGFDREVSVRLKRTLALLEPAIILVMAAVVGFIVISLLLAVFSLNDMTF